MAIEIRPVTEAEAVDYLRVLPFANGLPSWEPYPAAWHAGEGTWPPRPAPASEEKLASWVPEVMREDFRSQAALVDGEIVGASAMLSLEVTIPGPRQVAMGGVTGTGVIATHRRRGLLRAMMTAMLEDARERGEFLAGLSASEGGIYGRYGFSPATFQVRWELERGDARFADTSAPEGSLELVGADVAKVAWPQLHESVRAHRVGEVSAQDGKWEGLSDEGGGTDGPLRFLIHRARGGEVDGIAHYRLPWSADENRIGTVQVEAFESGSPAAYSAMWRLLADIDLSRRIVAAKRPVDDPLRWMLASPRALRITRTADNLWLRILDVGAALEARAYDATGALVLAVTDPMCSWNAGRWRLDASPDGASCRLVPDAQPDVTLDVNALASLYLGGVSASALAAAGRLQEHRPGAVATLARLCRQDPAPFNAVGF